MRIKSLLSNRYNQLEVVFFITYYILFSVFSGFEYYLIEKQDITHAFRDAPERIFYGLKALLPGIVFYKLLIQGFLFRRKYLYFFISLVIFLVLLNLYIHWGYWLISRFSFLPEQMTTNAAKWYTSKTPLHFSIIYMFREFLVLTALAYFIRAAKQERHIATLSNQQLQSELAILKAQVQPHFFFNTLNNIYSLTIQRSDKAAPLIVRYADIMRHVLYNGSATIIPLKQEIAFLQKYVEVESARYPDTIQITFEQQGITDNAMIEPTLFLPVIENVFKHGISQETKKGFVFIIFSLIDGELSIEVSNSIPQTKMCGNMQGIGLLNVKKRLELLYPGAYTLTIQEEEKIYRISIVLQIKRR